MKNIYAILICLLSGFYATAQCPAGQTEITIEIFHPSFGNEVGWELVDQTAGTVIACQPAGTYATSPTPTIEGPYCVTDGNTIVFTGYDSFGDDWNGGFFNVIVTEDGSVNGCAAQDGCVVLANAGEDVDVEPDVTVTNSCETSNEEFVVTLPVFACDATTPDMPIMGCTDMSDPNFNPCATIDDGSCVCTNGTQTGIVTGDAFCSTDAAATATIIIPDSPINAVQTVDGNFDGEHGIGLYQGTFDDGTVIGLPPAGTGLFGTDTETSIEGSTPGANNITTVGNWGNPSSVGNSITSAPLTDGATYTVFTVDDFGDGWDGSDVDLVDCEGNVVLANLAQYIDAIGGNAQDELAWATFTYNAPPTTVIWAGTGAVTTDPDATPNSGDEVYTFDPSMAGATGCDPTDVDLTMTLTSCGITCEQVVTVTVYPPAQAPTVVRNDATCTYTLTPACPNDVLAPAIADAAPGDDPAPIDITVTTEYGCMGVFPVNPEACPACPTSDFTPPIASEFVCDGATLTYPMAGGVDFNITDTDGTQLGGMMWFDGNDPTTANAVTTTAPVAHSGADVCATDPAVTHYAFVQCDADMDGAFDIVAGDSWVQVALHTYEVYAPAQMPTITRDDDVCNYTIVPACANDVLDITTTTAAPGEDPAAIDVTVTTENGCTAIFSVDPELCTDAAPVLSIGISDPCNCNQGLDLNGDNINEFAQETVTVTPGVPPYTISSFTGNLYDNTGSPILTAADLNTYLMGTDVVFYVDADGVSTYSVTIMDDAGQSATVNGGPCVSCPFEECPPQSADAGSLNGN